jgi:hypothetical protein
MLTRGIKMQEIAVYDPPMCCPTGVCGAAPDPELAQVANNLNLLAKQGVVVKRYNLSQNPGAFVQHAEVRQLLKDKETGALPIVIIDGQLKLTGRYPTTSEWSAWISGIKE